MEIGVELNWQLQTTLPLTAMTSLQILILAEKMV